MLTGLEWVGSLLGLLGAYLLATHSRVSRYGWLAFLAANVAMVIFALGIQRYGLLVQQAGFMGTSLLGLRRAGLWPSWRAEQTSTDRGQHAGP
jgi:drug/metabolite transporter (DMT)-like permease